MTTVIRRSTNTAVYNTQVKTFSIAKAYCNDFRSITHGSEALKPPHCLRVVKEHRTPEMQAFRDVIAVQVKQRSE